MVRRKPKKQGGYARNPADVEKGIDASKQTYDRSGRESGGRKRDPVNVDYTAHKRRELESQKTREQYLSPEQRRNARRIRGGMAPLDNTQVKQAGPGSQHEARMVAIEQQLANLRMAPAQFAEPPAQPIQQPLTPPPQAPPPEGGFFSGGQALPPHSMDSPVPMTRELTTEEQLQGAGALGFGLAGAGVAVGAGTAGVASISTAVASAVAKQGPKFARGMQAVYNSAKGILKKPVKLSPSEARDLAAGLPRQVMNTKKFGIFRRFAVQAIEEVKQNPFKTALLGATTATSIFAAWVATHGARAFGLFELGEAGPQNAGFVSSTTLVEMEKAQKRGEVISPEDLDSLDQTLVTREIIADPELNYTFLEALTSKPVADGALKVLEVENEITLPKHKSRRDKIKENNERLLRGETLEDTRKTSVEVAAQRAKEAGLR